MFCPWHQVVLDVGLYRPTRDEFEAWLEAHRETVANYPPTSWTTATLEQLWDAVNGHDPAPEPVHTKPKFDPKLDRPASREAFQVAMRKVDELLAKVPMFKQGATPRRFSAPPTGPLPPDRKTQSAEPDEFEDLPF